MILQNLVTINVVVTIKMTTTRIVTTRTRTSQCSAFGTVVKVSAKCIRFTSKCVM